MGPHCFPVLGLLSSPTPCIQADEIIPKEIRKIVGYQFLVLAQLLRCREERERVVYGRNKKK
jgi:hypothetical protein